MKVIPQWFLLIVPRAVNKVIVVHLFAHHEVVVLVEILVIALPLHILVDPLVAVVVAPRVVVDHTVEVTEVFPVQEVLVHEVAQEAKVAVAHHLVLVHTGEQIIVNQNMDFGYIWIIFS